MNILYIVHRIPYPPDKGDKIRSHRWLERLASKHDVHLITWCDDPADLAHRAKLEAICKSVTIQPLSKRKARLRTLLKLPADRPLSLAYFDAAPLRSRAMEIIEKNRIDVALCFSAPTAELVRDWSGPKVMDMVDVDSAKFASYSQRMAPPMKWIYGLEAKRLDRYEVEIAGTFDATILCTEPEAGLLRGRARDANIVAIGNGTRIPELPLERSQEAGNLVFVGAMDYLANVDAVVFAANEIMPLVRERRPDAVFHIVGRDPSSAVRALDGKNGVRVHGAVPDLSSYLLRASASLVPLRIAQGIQNKILEAMAYELPVVTARRIVPSLGAAVGRHLLAAESPKEYADATVSLLDDREAARRMGVEARRFVAEHFTWEPLLDRLESLLSTAVANREREGVTS